MREQRVMRCQVYVDRNMKKGTIGLPPEFFEETHFEPGHRVVLSKGNQLIKVRGHENELLKNGEIALSPRLALFLELDGADCVYVMDKSTLGDELFDEVESFAEVLKGSAQRILHMLSEAGEDVERAVTDTVGDALERLLDIKRDEIERYPSIEPNPEDFGIPRAEVCEMPEEPVETWSPDSDGDGTVRVFDPDSDGDGKVRTFRPGGEDETQDEE